MSRVWLNSVVLITSSDSAIRDFGTGFVIHREEQTTYILTCAHVVEAVGGSATVKVDDIQATVVALDSDSGVDLAVLSVVGIDKTPLSLGTTCEKGKSFTAAGFQWFNNNKEFLFRPLNGVLGEQVQVGAALAKFVKAWDLKITDDYQLQPGNSGSPVVDVISNTVVGVVRTRQGDGQKGLAISVEALAKIWPQMPSNILAKEAYGPSFENTSLTIVITALVKNAPAWLDALRKTLLEEGKQNAIEQGKGNSPKSLDKKEYLRHLQLALKNAAERGLTQFYTPEEQDQYHDILNLLSQSNPRIETICREAITLFSLVDPPKIEKLQELHDYSQHFHALLQKTSRQEVDVVPYLRAFFQALITELHSDPLFRDQMGDALKSRAGIQRSSEEVLATLYEIDQFLAEDYSVEQFERDIETYSAYIQRTLNYLKLVGVVPKDRGDKNTDPELNDIFVPLRVAFQSQQGFYEEDQNSIIALLEHHPYAVLLGGPGSGKSTAVRHLAWSHALANQEKSSISSIPFLGGKPLPLRIECRRLTEDRRRNPDYNFLSYTTEVVLGRDGVEINPRMFKELLERRTMLLLFDGLDEVANLDERRRLVEEIEHFALFYPGNRILITSRPVGYELAPFSFRWFKKAQVQEFNDEQIRQFLERWYTHVLKLSPIPYSDIQELESLFMILKENSRLHKLAVNPLLLTVITALHRYERLPDRRVLIYDRCADLLLETWAKLKGTDVRWKDIKMTKEDQYACVAYLGFVLHERSQNSASNTSQAREDIANDVTTRFMLREMESFLNNRKLLTEVAEQRSEAKRFLELMQVEAGLIVERGKDESGEDLYGFVHRTFQEYFAAADVYERYQQEEDPNIISEFLKKVLHDPHWHEVVLLLLGKLKRKPVTTQLRQILQGKIKSGRSQYTDLLQQDLFFVSDCLAEEIAVESELAELVIQRLRKVVEHSAFPSQRQEALKALGSLARTRQYHALAVKELIELATSNRIHLETKIEAAKALYLSCFSDVEKQRASEEILSHLLQHKELPVKQIFEAARGLYQLSRHMQEERQLAIQMLLRLARRPDLSFKRTFKWVWGLYRLSFHAQEGEHLEDQQLATQMLLQLTQRPNLSIRQSILLAQALYRLSLERSEDEQLATQMLLRLARRPDLSTKQMIQAAQALYWASSEGSEERQLATQMLLRLARYPDLSVAQVFQAAWTLRRASPQGSEERQQATQVLLRLSHRPDISFRQVIQIAQKLYHFSPPGSEEQSLAAEMLLQLAHRSDLSIVQVFQGTQAVYYASSEGSEERQQATHSLLNLAQHPKISFRQALQSVQRLYRWSSQVSVEQQLAIQLLLRLIHRPGLSIKQMIQVAQSLYWVSLEGSEDEQQAGQLLLNLAERPDLPLEQVIQIAEVFSGHARSEARFEDYGTQLVRGTGSQRRQAPYDLEDSIMRHKSLSRRQLKRASSPYWVQEAFQLLLNHTTRPGLSIKQMIQVAQSLYWVSLEGSEDEQQAGQLLLNLAERPDLPLEQVIQIAEVFSGHARSEARFEDYGTHKERQLATQMLLRLARRPDLSTKQMIQAAQALYWASSEGSEEEQQSIELLELLAERSDLPFEQVIQIAEVFSGDRHSEAEFEDHRTQLVRDTRSQRRPPNQLFWRINWLFELLAERSDLPFEQVIQIADVYYRCNGSFTVTIIRDGTRTEEQTRVTQRLLELAQRPDLSTEQVIQIADLLYNRINYFQPAPKLALQMTRVFVQRQNVPVDDKLQVIAVPLTSAKADYSDLAETVQIVLSLIQGEAAKKYIAEQWQAHSEHNTDSNIYNSTMLASAIELVEQQVLPINVRDKLYQKIRDAILGGSV